YKSLEGGSGSSEHTSSSENTKSSRTKPVALPSERARALLESRRSRKVRFELMPGDKPADPTQQHYEERLQPILKQSIERQAAVCGQQHIHREENSRSIKKVIRDIEILQKEMKRLQKAQASMRSRQREGGTNKRE
ncbi:hypothetical protein PENSUB_4131, partial [Penicillium subrubescens]